MATPPFEDVAYAPQPEEGGIGFRRSRTSIPAAEAGCFLHPAKWVLHTRMDRKSAVALRGMPVGFFIESSPCSALFVDIHYVNRCNHDTIEATVMQARLPRNPSETDCRGSLCKPLPEREKATLSLGKARRRLSKKLRKIFRASGKQSFNRFRPRRVRGRKHFSGCKCGICLSKTDKLCAQQTAKIWRKSPKGFFDKLKNASQK